MTSSELRARLLELDPDGTMEVVCRRYSDYQEVPPEDVEVVEGIKKPSAGYVMRTHRSMPSADWTKARPFICFAGN